MLLARLLNPDPTFDLELGFARLALTPAARSLFGEQSAHLHLLLTGLEPSHQRFLQAQKAPGLVLGDPRHRPGSALMGGRRERFTLLTAAAKEAEGMLPLALALEAALQAHRPPPPLTLAGRTFCFGERTFLMGVVNATPDSFSDGGRFLAPEAAVARGLSLVAEGADLLDVGGESTRPGSLELPVEEELRRVVPVIEALREQTLVPISIDTRKAAVAEEALRAGATLVNDVSGLGHDPRMAEVAARAGAAVCLMHALGTPQTMQRTPRYQDAVEEIIAFLAQAVQKALAAGIPKEKVVVDPGIGFGKSFEHNHFLLRRLSDLRVLGLPVLVGPSRKAFLGALAGGKPAPGRVLATAACAAAVAMTRGADFLRVHDVAEVREALAVAEALRAARDGGALFDSAP